MLAILQLRAGEATLVELVFHRMQEGGLLSKQDEQEK
jgi:hypothetical protein